MFWPYGVIAIAIVVSFVVGYILGEFAGIKQTEQRWTEAVTRAGYK